MSVTRYELKTKYRGNESWDELEESSDGMYVRYEDFAESQREFRAADATIENLQMQVEKLAAENAGLKSIQAWAVADVFKSGAKLFESTKAAGFDTDDCLHDAVLVMLSELKPPATNAFLAEVRAQGVEMFAAHKRERQQALRTRSMRMSEEAAGMAADAEDFAAQLRQEAAQ